MQLRVWFLGATTVVFIVAVFSHRWLNARPLQAQQDSVLASSPRAVSLPKPRGSAAPRGTNRTDHAVNGADHEARRVEQPAPVTPVLAKHGRATALQNNLNALLVGLDGRHGTSRGRPDTILLLSFSEGSGQLGMVSIPRDLYIDIPGHGPDRINATYSVAQRQKQPPLELLKRVVEDTLQVPITHAISIDLNGFERVIDAIGGVDVKVPCPIADNFIDPRMPRKRRRLDVNAGVTHMDGVTAAMYVRSRHGRSDWSRARRQQAVLLAMQRRMLTPAGLARLPRWFDELGAFISTPMTRAEMFGLAPRLIKLRPERLHGIVLGHREARPHRTEAGKSVLLPDPEAIATRLAQLFSAKKPGTMPRAARCPPKDVALQRRTQTGSAAAMRHAIEKGSR